MAPTGGRGGWSTGFPRGFSEFQVGFLSGNMENYAFPWNMKSLKIFIHISHHCCVPYMLHMTNQQNLNFCYCCFISDLFSIVCGLQFTCKTFHGKKTSLVQGSQTSCLTIMFLWTHLWVSYPFLFGWKSAICLDSISRKWFNSTIKVSNLFVRMCNALVAQY